MRKQFGVVALEVRATYGAPEVAMPIKGAVQGAGAGALATIVVGGDGGGPPGLVLGILLSPFGAIGGAIAAHSSEEVTQAHTNLVTALKETDLAVLLRKDVRAKEHETARRVVVNAASMVDADTGNKLAADSRLELDLFDLQLLNEGAFSPDVTALLMVRGSVRLGDGGCLLQRTWFYRSQARNYFELAANQAALLRRELEVAADKVAAKIVSDLFVSTQTESVRDLGNIKKLNILKVKTVTDAGTVVTIRLPLATQDLKPACPAPTPIQMPAPAPAVVAPWSALSNFPLTIDVAKS